MFRTAAGTCARVALGAGLALAMSVGLGACAPQAQKSEEATTKTVVELPPAAQAGTVTITSNGLNCTAQLLTAQPAEGEDFTFEYSITIKNDGDDLEEWSLDIPFSKPITFVSGENADFVANGSVLTVKGRAYNSLFPTGSEFKGMSFKVKADGNAVIVPHS